ncbi:molybdate transport system regulatory protein [Neisseria sp. HSC-16F19]|nr:TOBE domain-containing protein [Neisseria sp. HSC-16F19]MCP2040689.1 molybdate transport system regulatory protein [Neisseria sp. HSC-16F19]
MKSSARNQLAGTVTTVSQECDGYWVGVRVSEHIELQACISSRAYHKLKPAPGQPVVAMIKASQVMLATELAPMTLSADNIISGTVVHIAMGAVNNVLALDIGDGLHVYAAITLHSSETLALHPGSAATAIFNANQVVLAALV